MQRLIDEGQGLSEIPADRRNPAPNTLDHDLWTSEDRNKAIYKAYQSRRYTLKQLGDYFTLHYSAVAG
jgi:putative transposase